MEIECEQCENGKNCPMRTSVAKQQAIERGEIEIEPKAS